ncbi:hypothetical protein KY321_05540 [Candidatus Woesearchaeota archaeon]|nr:hypothetical protein [Candidatus Woesearchaeota archaeon]
MNPIKYLDDFVMYGVDRMVAGINWTTGFSKKEIANIMLGVAPIVETSGYMAGMNHNVPSYIFTGMLSSLFIGISHFAQRENEVFENLENKALDSEVKDSGVELKKNIDCSFGYLAKVCGAYHLYLGAEGNEPLFGGIAATGFTIRGLSHQVMRLDGYPPQKNCISRGLDNLTEYLTKKELKPIPIKIKNY